MASAWRELGKSGKSAETRSGFQRLVALVSLGQVGAILSLQVSRLARSSADWHRLMRLRLFGGKLHQAKKGERAFPPPTGYVFEGGVTACRM